MNKVIWTKEELNGVIGHLLTSPFLIEYKGISFFRAHHAESDPLMQYLYGNAALGGGAVSSLISRPIIDSSNKINPSPVSVAVLENTTEEQTVYFVTVMDCFFAANASLDVLKFIIAHEIHHVLAGDLSLNNQVELNSPAYIAREIASDKFAVELLGTNIGAFAVLENSIRFMESPEFIAQGNDPVAVAAAMQVVVERMKHL